jgi:hypothetical protein
MSVSDSRTPEDAREGGTTHDKLRYKAFLLERGSEYRTFVIFLEMRGIHHRGLIIERDGAVLAKGVIANHVRRLGLPNVEMAMPPPPDSNAILVVRLTGPNDDEILDRIVGEVRSFLKSQGFDSLGAPADATLKDEATDSSKPGQDS